MICRGSTWPSRRGTLAAVPLAGSLQETGDRWLPFRLLDTSGEPVEAVSAYFRDLQAVGRSAGHGACDQPPHVLRQVPRERGHDLVDVPEGGGGDVVALERALAREALVGDDAQGVDVAGGRRPVALDSLRGEVVHRAHDCARPRQPAGGDGLGDAEVRQSGSSIFAQQDVLGLHVAVDQALFVRVLERGRERGAHRANLGQPSLQLVGVGNRVRREALQGSFEHALDDLGRLVRQQRRGGCPGVEGMDRPLQE